MARNDHSEYRSELRDGYRRLATSLPETMNGFERLHRAAVADGELSRATKEMMALAIGIAAGCDGCITLHAHAALRVGATPEQVHEAIGVAVLMGGGPASVHAIEALDAVDHFTSSLA